MALVFKRDSANFFGLLLGLLIFGCYIVIFGVTIYMISLRSVKSRAVLSFLYALCVLATSYYVLAFVYVYHGFISERDSVGTLAYFSNPRNVLSPIKDVFFSISLILADAFLIFRLRVIWPENVWAFRVAIFLLLNLIALTLGIWIKTAMHVVSGNEIAAYHRELNRWGIAGSSIILATNLTVTGLITGRLIWLSKQMAVLGDRTTINYHSIAYVIVQNGSLYLLCIIIQLLVFASGIENADEFFVHMGPALVAIFPTAIILQLQMSAAEVSATVNQAVTSPSFQFTPSTERTTMLSPSQTRNTETKEDTEGSRRVS